MVFKYRPSLLTHIFNFPRNSRAYFLFIYYSFKVTHKTTGWNQHTLAMFLIDMSSSAQSCGCMPPLSMLIPYPGLCTLTSCHHSWDLGWWLSWLFLWSHFIEANQFRNQPQLPLPSFLVCRAPSSSNMWDICFIKETFKTTLFLSLPILYLSFKEDNILCFQSTLISLSVLCCVWPFYW